jgi:hypothetical protein
MMKFKRYNPQSADSDGDELKMARGYYLSHRSTETRYGSDKLSDGEEVSRENKPDPA